MNKIFLLGVLALAGCARVEFIPLSAPCPPKPLLPKISREALAPLSETAYRQLVERELRLKEYIGLLEVNCE